MLQGEPSRIETHFESEQPLVAGSALVSELHRAVLDNDLATVRRLLKKRHVPADVDQCSITPAMRAASLGLPKILRLLLEAGARGTAVDVNGRCPLHYACSEFSSERTEELEEMLQRRKVCVQLLMRACSQAAQIRDKFGKTPADLCSALPVQGPFVSFKFMDTRQLLWYLGPDASLSHDPLEELEDDDDHDRACCYKCCKRCVIL